MSRRREDELLRDDEKGLMALKIFRHYGVRADEELRYGHLITMCAKWRWKTSDIADGIDFGVEMGWFERLPNGRIKLSEAGYWAG